MAASHGRNAGGRRAAKDRTSVVAKYPISDGIYDLRQFDIARPDEIQQKLVTFRAADPSEFMLVADFDNTLARRGYGIWEALRNALPEVGRLESDSERSINLAKEQAGTLTAEEVIMWSKHELARYAKYGITTSAIAQAARRVKLRRGARKLLNICAKANMERHILSASVADAIELVAKQKKLQPTQIHSNRLRTKGGIVVEWNEDRMFHNLNKHEHAVRLVLSGLPAQDDQRYKIVLGDTRHDADVVSDKNVLRIRVHGKHGNTPEYLAESFAKSNTGPGFDLVLRTESLLPAVDLVQWLTTKSSPRRDNL